MEREMKDSGIEWIGEIPSNWKTKRLKLLAEIKTGSTPSKEEEYNKNYSLDGMMWVKPDNLQGDKLIKKTKEYLSIYGEKYAVKAKAYSILVCCIGNIGKIGYTDRVVAYNQQINSVNFNDNIINWKFGLYLLIISKSEHYYYSNGTIIKILNNKGQGEIKYAYPSRTEQERIANYLDKKCSEIDIIIKKTKTIIEEYKIYKQSMITEAVTKGLNKNVKMKDSGIEWVGEIPRDWKIVKLKYLFSINKIIANSPEYNILSVTKNGIRIKDISKNKGQVADNYNNYQIVKINDFVMNHMDLLTGWVDCSKINGVTSPDYRVFTLDKIDICNRDYYTYIFQLCYKNKVFYGLGQGVSNLGRWRLQTDKFINFKLPVPKFEEQQEIILYIDKKCSEIDSNIKIKQAIITELESYKKSLIYEYVTGKKEI